MIDLEFLKTKATGVPKKHKDKYRKYLGSEEWLQLRLDIHHERNCECEGCGWNKDLHVHHITYDNLFKETYQDLALLCKRCHRYVHGMCKNPGRGKKNRKQRKNNTVVVKHVTNNIIIKDTIAGYRIDEIIKDKDILPKDRESIIKQIREAEKDYIMKLNSIYTVKE